MYSYDASEHIQNENLLPSQFFDTRRSAEKDPYHLTDRGRGWKHAGIDGRGLSMDKRNSDEKKAEELREQKKATERPDTRKQKPRGTFTGKK